jgi:predicted nucleic acid-binding protein
MVLVDTSVWISHFRAGNKRLASLLNGGEVVSHPFVIGELACGNLKNRSEILSLLKTLPSAKKAAHDEIMAFIEDAGLEGRGLGYIDIHLLASALLSNVPLWTIDRKLDKAATDLEIKY